MIPKRPNVKINTKREKKRLKKMGLIPSHDSQFESIEETMGQKSKTNVTVIRQDMNNEKKTFNRKVKNCTFMFIDIRIKTPDKDSALGFDYGEIIETAQNKKGDWYKITRVAAFSYKQLYFLLEHEGISFDSNKNIIFAFCTLAEAIKKKLVTKNSFIDWKDDVNLFRDRDTLGTSVYKELMKI